MEIDALCPTFNRPWTVKRQLFCSVAAETAGVSGHKHSKPASASPALDDNEIAMSDLPFRTGTLTPGRDHRPHICRPCVNCCHQLPAGLQQPRSTSARSAWRSTRQGRCCGGCPASTPSTSPASTPGWTPTTPAPYAGSTSSAFLPAFPVLLLLSLLCRCWTTSPSLQHRRTPLVDSAGRGSPALPAMRIASWSPAVLS
jgi:hypothetical protein